MLKKLTRHFRTVAPVVDEQLMLDTLRYNNADNQLMQLHADRMQTALNAR